MHELFHLSGRMALVTGASSGIGRDLAHALAGAAAAVVALARSRDGLDETVAMIADDCGRAAPVPADLADPAGIEGPARRAANVAPEPG